MLRQIRNKFDFGIPSPRGMMMTMMMQEVDAGGGCRRRMHGVDAGGWMQGVYRWIPPGWLRAWGTVGGKIAPEAPRGAPGEI